MTTVTKSQALKLARAKWGESAHVRYNRAALSAEARRLDREELQELRTRKPETAGELRKWQHNVAALTIRATTVLYYVGFRSSLAFHVRGQGDSWEEACQKAGLL